MKKAHILMALVSGVVMMQMGCGGNGKMPTKTGFLSDYSSLRAASDSSLKYINEQALGEYSKFIVDPVEVYFYGGSRAERKRPKAS